MRLIAIDTATERCSAALWVDGELYSLSERAPQRHGDLILGQVETLLAEAGIDRHSLDAVAVGRGPGAFTGVRLGLGVAQGLAFALDCSVVPVSSLQVLAQQGLRLAPEPAPAAVLAALDARMGEVYWSLCPVAGERVLPAPEAVAPPEAVVPQWPAGERLGLGTGFRAFPELAGQCGLPAERVDPDALPDAFDLALLAVDARERGEGVDPADAQPVYLRDDVARPAATP
ncbi:tRNA (adenosine(37)-N6)-threonylcarbamoyltransferase complex dimerization subunit type 1 TsaB [Thioalkalivibrio sp. ALE20]|uniref:tRNA (adenosine(37)-N6)-threonylcarbamoyltransferase complex dimerization subunit type 1 TsaB n=1 Tax=Thioalkalivibrio sp. ALE20 TaxID=545275 RepID=UPI00038290F4|nr:tRNA (adenosine(37)-N6)-threonylcarbamoyltransferase complex dimerization subunit type 1 TsaB [Thioalkalivibrio sp. ALE20]